MGYLSFFKEYKKLNKEEKEIGKDFIIWASKNYNIFDLAFDEQKMIEASNEYKKYREGVLDENKSIEM